MDEIKEYLINNQEFIKECCSNLNLTRSFCLERHPEFEEIINDQYLLMARSIIIYEVTKALAISTEAVILVLEEIDLREYLK